MEHISEKKVVEKLETHILCTITFFFPNCAVYEIMWKILWSGAGHRY